MANETAPAAPAPVAPVNVPAPAAVPPKNADATFRANISKMAKDAFSGKDPMATPVEAPSAKPDHKLEAKPATKNPEPVAEQAKPVEATPVSDNTEVFPEDSLEKPKGPSRPNWDKLESIAKNERAAARMAKKEADDIRAQLDKMSSASPAERAEMEAIKAEKKALEDRLAVVKLEEHPDFIRQFAEPKRKALEEAKMLMTDNQIADQPDFAALMAKPRPEFAKIVSELGSKMNEMDRSTFLTQMREAYRIQGDEKVALSKSGELAEQLKQKTAAQQKQAFEETWQSLGKEKTLLNLLPEGTTAEEKAEAAEYNKAIESIRPSAEKYAFGRLSTKEQASVAQKAALFDVLINVVAPRANKQNQALLANNKALADEIRSLQVAKSPGSFNSTPARQEEAAPNQAKTQKDFRQIIKEESRKAFAQR